LVLFDWTQQLIKNILEHKKFTSNTQHSIPLHESWCLVHPKCEEAYDPYALYRINSETYTKLAVTLNLTKLLQLNTKPRRKKGGKKHGVHTEKKPYYYSPHYGIHSNSRILDIGTSLTLLT
jgi:hypothetical protein